MPNLFVRRGLAFFVLPCLLISACSIANKNPAKQTSVESGKSIAAGEFQKALDTYKAASKRNPLDSELAGNYVRVIEEIRRAADQALGRQDYARAANIYRVLLNSYADFGALAPTLSFNKAQLETALKNCRTALVENPVQEALKAGNFARALDVYQAALKENPGDAELTASYVRTVEEIRRAADQALARQDYARAGTIYRVLLNSYADFGAFAAKLTFKKAYLDVTLKYCRIAPVDSQARQALKAGNFARALDTYQAALKENPGDADFAAKYRGMVNDIKAAGDRALGDKDFAQAGRVNVFLLKNFPSFEGLRPPVAFSRVTLSEAIAVCRDGLTKAGLEEYRKGNLAKAIAVWEDLLTFDPDNAEIKKAVNTARTQLNGIIKKK
ncbi:MAG: tetratricopeptide repeat protein [Candidatus Aminicenantales bacterium]